MAMLVLLLDDRASATSIDAATAGRLAALGTVSELKQIFAGRPIVEVRGSQPVHAMQVLEHAPEVEKTSVFGTAVHAVLRSREADTSALASRLRTSGVAAASIAVVEPSLEDVFLDVVERMR